MEPIESPIRGYAWGSRTVLASLQGRPAPSPGPEAELWIGAHPAAPSMLDGEDGPVSLADAIAAAPAGWLGAALAERHGPRLPFLLKILAAESPLSLQAHPDLSRARERFAAGDDNYVDANHKPELLVALTPFDALCGFRDPARSAEVFAAIGVPALDPVVEHLRGGPEGLRAAVHLLLSWPADDRPALLAAFLAADAAQPTAAADLALARELAGQYPADPGVLVALLLNHVQLAPGEAVWMPAGNLHAYLRGAGIEVMAASDNVLRGGLTPKRVDVDELLRVLRFEVLVEPVVKAVTEAAGVDTWPVPVDDFALHRVRLDGDRERVELAVDGPVLAVGTAGSVSVGDATGVVSLTPGRSAVGPAGAGPLVLSGTGEVFVASSGA